MWQDITTGQVQLNIFLATLQNVQLIHSLFIFLKRHIKDNISVSQDLHQYAIRTKWFTEDAISTALYCTSEHTWRTRAATSWCCLLTWAQHSAPSYSYDIVKYDATITGSISNRDDSWNFRWKSTILQSGSQWRTNYCSTSGKYEPNCWFQNEGVKATHPCLHQWSWGGAGEQFKVPVNQHHQPGKNKKALLPTETKEDQILMPSSHQLLQRSNRKNPDWKHHKCAWFITAQNRKALQLVIKTFQNITASHSVFTLLPSDKTYGSITIVSRIFFLISQYTTHYSGTIQTHHKSVVTL